MEKGDAYRGDVKVQHFLVEGRDVGQEGVKAPVRAEVGNDDGPYRSRGGKLQPRHSTPLERRASK